mmetsp:Transcript_64037/g.75797  ORF Transcript_64037/g.75797 Transcript_64037/m.75797 type:complete len:102 (-) Transcript_64037:193-498(-)
MSGDERDGGATTRTFDVESRVGTGVKNKKQDGRGTTMGGRGGGNETKTGADDVATGTVKFCDLKLVRVTTPIGCGAWLFLIKRLGCLYLPKSRNAARAIKR